MHANKFLKITYFLWIINALQVFFSLQINDKTALFYRWRGKKKKIISTEMDDGLLCWRQNSCNRNGNVLPLSDHVRFWDAFSRVAIWVTGLSYFPPLCLCWLLLITQWDAESGLFRAWQKSNLMNLMRLFDLSDPPHTHTDTGGHLFSLILSTVLWGWSLSQYVLGRSQENTLDKLWVHKRADRDKQTRLMLPLLIVYLTFVLIRSNMLLDCRGTLEILEIHADSK